MSTLLLIRPRGPHTGATTGTTTLLETSIEALTENRVDLLAYLRTMPDAFEMLGALILEDLRFDDLDDDLRAALLRAMAGSSCPIATRWSNPRQGSAG